MRRPRHLLVLASQCESMGPKLANLEKVAFALQNVFLDPDIGACIPGLPDGAATPCGGSVRLAKSEIWTALDTADAFAAEHNADIVLIILGHAFVSADDLYFMGIDATEDHPVTAVNISHKLKELQTNPRLPGVVVIADTCAAGGAAPDLRGVQNGLNAGAVQISALLACGKHEPASDFRMSMELERILQRGLAGSELALGALTLREHLQQAVVGQTIVAAGYSADPLAAGAPWIALNVASVPHSLIGELGTQRLGAALDALTPTPVIPPDYSSTAWTRLREEVAAAEPGGYRRRRALDILEIVEATARTVVFLRRFLRSSITPTLFRSALPTLDALGAPPQIIMQDIALTSDTAFLEHVALSRSNATEFSYKMTLACFVAGVTRVAGQDLNSTDLLDWAESIGAVMEFNECRKRLEEKQQARSLRLIVSLHASLTGDRWPVELDAWLLEDGRDAGHLPITCSEGQTEVEKGLLKALRWALSKALSEHGRRPLRRIEIVLPTGLLLKWRPETVKFGKLLGVEYEVTTRWTWRLRPPDGFEWMLPGARRQLAASAGMSGSAIEWLDEPTADELEDLREDLEAGVYQRSVALTGKPSSRDTLDLLLSHLPEVLWPWSIVDFPPHDRAELQALRQSLPDAFHSIRRYAWETKTSPPIADLRWVWDDDEWLTFCEDYWLSGRQRETS